MAAEDAAPCRHRGAPPEDVVARVVDTINAIALDASYLLARGLSSEEFQLSLPAAIEKLRGSRSASNGERRDFLTLILDFLTESGAISGYTRPAYGADTIYRVTVPGLGDVALIQKGCPDGRHSSVSWTVPDWAVESYLWWLCPSLKGEPGWHVSAGVNRLKAQFFSDRPDFIDGVIFHNNLCGTDLRPCPKMERSAQIGDLEVPPPCVWVFPRRGTGPNYNWDGSRDVKFPAALFSAFGIASNVAPLFTGHVGFQTGRAVRTSITSRFGAGRSTTSRS